MKKNKIMKSILSYVLVFIIMFYVILVYQFQDNNFVTTFAFISAISYYPILF